MDFEGKVVIITGLVFLTKTYSRFLGSSSGLGQDAALMFALKGAKVTIHGQNPGRIAVSSRLLVYV
jgi:NAD(P)-dependent dehydrogenase (short-subunit alcohol dehydrogenase family)